MNLMKNALIILAGGKGKRIGGRIPKQFKKYGNYNFIEYLLNMNSIRNFDIIIIASYKNFRMKYLQNVEFKFNKPKILFSNPGSNRQESSFNALKKLRKYKPTNVLIHDGARPMVSNNLIEKILFSLKKNHTAVPYVWYNDRIIINNKEIKDKIKNIQTPQGFKFNLIHSAHIKLSNYNFPDDSALIQKLRIQAI